ncbi:hypothetical protein G6F57_003976 [Rhizopus arrhizus]|uniref:Uncharacterized protein n=1 Tax=Rhizopus oryzae TaxID=64495 RepID=A0A9P6XEW2_RHIOR|nr:hypothetical protein G6F30_004249 [Rhizopus arrhizus]KAG0984498.1 hypothetical protein G6F29_004730 [Rhizopus arrhizus]KAG0995356.1 hypothetical protein G6F28_004867 [Rhizopus arrhizus]KAG1010122.1 hypothetical protein G6F27_004951 [Rhizopus arrhizus]KAG1026181.1 hypothetical protein G6F26_004497 [Rhizopus arrhizus]
MNGKGKGSKRKQEDTDEEEDADEEEDEKEDDDSKEEDKPNIWSDWLKYVNSNANAFHPYRSGKGVSPRPYLDRDLYNKHMEAHSTENYRVPESHHKFIDTFVDSSDLREAKKVIRTLSSFLLNIDDNDTQAAEELEFLESLLIAVHSTYSLHCDYRASEDSFSEALVKSFLEVISKSIRTNDCKADFVKEQPILESMTKQLKTLGHFVDDKSQYKSDGLKEIELLLVEVSGCFNNKDKVKLNFDHHKGMFGALAMIKSIADQYEYASVDQFEKVKVFFLNAAGRHLNLWSLSYKKNDLFDLWKESSLLLRPDFDDKQDFVPDLVQFCWSSKIIIEKSVESIVALKQDHSQNKAKCRYSSAAPALLSDIVNAIILKLTKEEDGSGIIKLGPLYSPPHP